MRDKLFSVVVTALLTIITLLISILGFMTREAYYNLKQQMVTVESKVGTLGEKVVRLETTISERAKKK